MNGICYIAFGDTYRDYCKRSVLSLRQSGYTGAVTVFADQDFECEATVVVTEGSAKEVKTKLGTLSPYENTIYIDADTLVLLPLDDLFETPVFAMRVMPGRNLVNSMQILLPLGYGTQEELDYSYTICGYGFPFYNSGVFAWKKCDQCDALFASWNDEWNKFKDVDQLPLYRAMFINRFLPSDLDAKYNRMVTSTNPRTWKPNSAIVHFAGPIGEDKPPL